MNGNRSKYSYTPTYGMQKRGMLKKPASARPIPEAPDFTQVPDPVIGVPLQQNIPPQSLQSTVPFNSYPQANTMPYAGQTQPIPVQSTGDFVSSQQTTFVMPDFVQTFQAAQYPPMQSMPLQNQTSIPVQPAGNKHVFSPRTQGFVPPSGTASPYIQTAPVAPVQPARVQAQQPVQQSIPPFAGARMPSAYQEMPVQSMNVQQSQTFSPFQPVPQSTGFTVQQTPPPAAPRSPSTDIDKLLSIFLFGLLPLLFIPCIFSNAAWNAFRYVFIAATVAGLGAMWYRQLFTPIVRLISSIVYVGLCVVAIALLMQGGDARHVSANLGSTQTAQTTLAETPAPQSNAAVSAPADTPEPTVSGPSEAERRLALFMELWKVNNTTEMVNLVQPSWRSQQENASTSLFFILANRTPEDFTIEEISGTETDSSRTVTMRATINKNTGKAPQVYRFMVMMVKDGGDWYVNPNSLATNDVEEKKQADENVVKTQGGGAITEPPRETVTPAPPGSTLLYYNLGGNFYHMDPECPSVGRDYLPFDASFPYSELRSYNRDLLPCLNCNAPIDPLD